MKKTQLLTALIISTLTTLSFGMNEVRAEGEIETHGNNESIDGKTYQNIEYTGDGGAMIYDNDGVYTIENSHFINNKASNNGGAVYNGAGSTLTIKGSTFSGNSTTSGNGADIFNLGVINFEGINTFGKAKDDELYNAGTAVNKGTFNGHITNSASGTLTNTGTISGNLINNGKLTSNASLITGTIKNDGNSAVYNVTGGAISNAITGSGKTIIDGTNVSLSAAIENAVTINSSKDLTITNASINIGNGIENHGTLTVVGSTGESAALTFNTSSVNNGTASNGSTIFRGNVTNNTDITQNSVSASFGSKVTNNADITATEFTNGGSFENNTGSITANTITNNYSLTSEVDKLTGAVVNNSELVLKSGASLGITDISGTNGVTKINDGTSSIDLSSINVAQKGLVVGKGNELTAKIGESSLNIGSDGITNAGTLNLQGSTGDSAVNYSASIKNDGENKGETVFTGKVNSSATINQSKVTNDNGTFTNTGAITANVKNSGTFTNTTGSITGNVTNTGASFTTGANKVSGSIDNSTVLNIKGGSSLVNSTITGITGDNGTTNIEGKVQNKVGAAISQKLLEIKATDLAAGIIGGEFTVNANDLNISNGITNNNKLNINGGSATEKAILKAVNAISGDGGITEFLSGAYIDNKAQINQNSVVNAANLLNEGNITVNIFTNSGTLLNQAIIDATAGSGVANTGSITTVANLLKGDVSNSNSLTLIGNSSGSALNSEITNITGNGTTYIEGKIQNKDGAGITQNSLIIKAADSANGIIAGEFTVKANELTIANGITNHNKLNINGGTEETPAVLKAINAISGDDGTTEFLSGAYIDNKAQINQNSVTNAANLTNENSITVKTFTNSGKLDNKALVTITQNDGLSNTGEITTAVNKISANSIDNSGILNLTGGTTANPLTMSILKIVNDEGTTNITSGIVNNIVDINQKTVTISEGATLNNSANTITVADSLLNEGTLSNGNGGVIAAASGKTFTNKSSVTNSGSITANIANESTFDTDGNITKNATIVNTGTLKKVTSNTGTITTKAEGLTDKVVSDGKIILQGGELDVVITNSTDDRTKGSLEITDNTTISSTGGITQKTVDVVSGGRLQLEDSSVTNIGTLTINENGTLALVDGAELDSNSTVQINNGNIELKAINEDVTFNADITSGSSYNIIANSTESTGKKVTIDSAIGNAKSITAVGGDIKGTTLDLAVAAINSLTADKSVTMGNNSIISLNATDTTQSPAQGEDVTFVSNISGDNYILNINNDGSVNKVTLNTTITGAKEIDVKSGILEIIDNTNINKTDVNLQNTSSLELNATEEIELTSNITGENSNNVIINNQTVTEPNVATTGVVKAQSVLDNLAIDVQGGEFWLTGESTLNDNSTVDVKADAILNVTDDDITNYENNIILNNNSHIKFDAHMITLETDNFANATIADVDNIVIEEFNPIRAEWIVNDSARINLKESLGIENISFSDNALAQREVVLTPIRRLVGYYNPDNATLNFTRTGNDYEDFNPAVYNSAVAAQIGGYLTQLDTYNQALSNMDMYNLMTKEERQALKFANKYAAADSNLIFSPLSNPNLETSAWFRPYTTFENVKLKYGPKVSNVNWGTFAGVESGLYDLGKGWDADFGVYVGYNGSHQAYQGNSIYQNGATLGILGMAFKDDFFVGTTINVSDNLADASNMYGKEDFNMLMSGAAVKAGYNWNLAEGRFIIQPSFQTSYSFVNTFDYTNSAGVRIKSDPLHAIQLEPQVKFIGNFKHGWQPYAHLSGVWTILDRADIMANDVSLPEISVKPYARYGFGLRKTFGDRVSGFFQTFFTSGGRNGMGLQLGFKIQLGDSKKKSVEIKPKYLPPKKELE